MFKKYLIFLQLGLSILLGNGQKGFHSISSFTSFEPGETYFVFGDDVKMRTGPGIQHQEIKRLRIGDKVKIIESTESFMTYNGINSRWYRIEHQNDNGYMLGGLIALSSLKDSGITILSSLEQQSSFAPKLRLRVLKDSNEYNEYVFNVIGTHFLLKLYDAKGLKGVKNLIEVDYISEACGMEGGVSYIYRDENALYPMANLSSMAEAGLFSVAQKFVFPADEGGIPDKIVYIKNKEVVEDETTGWVVKTEERRLLEWDGQTISPKPPFPEN